MIAAFLRTSDRQPLAKCIEQRDPRVERESLWSPVNFKTDGDSIFLRGGCKQLLVRTGKNILSRQKLEHQGAEHSRRALTYELSPRFAKLGQHLLEQLGLIERPLVNQFIFL